MHYVVNDYTDPWTTPETILMLHGNAESGEAWYGWVPTLARKYRVVRPDMRGFGASTVMPRDYPWTVEGLADDYIAFMDALKIEVLRDAFRESDPRLRRHLVRLSESRLNDEPGLSRILGLLVRGEDDPQLRMQLACTLGAWRDPQSGSLLGELAPQAADDRYLLAAVLSSVTKDNLEPLMLSVLAASRQKAFRFRISHSPSRVLRPSHSDHGNGLPAGSRVQPVLIATMRLTRSGWRVAYPMPIIPPQSCSTRVTSRVTPSRSSSVSRSRARLSRVYSYRSSPGLSDSPQPMWSGTTQR